MSVRRRFWYVMMITPLMISIVMSLIADLNNPGSGFLQTGRQSMRRLQHDLKGQIGQIRSSIYPTSSDAMPQRG
jgi:hypothetical protein